MINKHATINYVNLQEVRSIYLLTPMEFQAKADLLVCARKTGCAFL